MRDIIYKDRETGTLKQEQIYGKRFLELLYGQGFISKILSMVLLPIVARLPWISFLYGKLQKRQKSRKKILPFIQAFGVDMTECIHPIESFQSFNDFFIRKLKVETRPIAAGSAVAVLPADGRHLVFPDLSKISGLYVKGKPFHLDRLLNDPILFELYKKGSMLLSRLCPVDYHRYHFPCDCIPSEPQSINGALFSVSPLALKKRIAILNENKRVLTRLEAGPFGSILFIEVGATCVGSIKQTFTPHLPYKKGEEKGYFEFGGSCVILLFQPNKIIFDSDLIETSAQHIETYAKMGTSLGRLRATTIR